MTPCKDTNVTKDKGIRTPMTPRYINDTKGYDTKDIYDTKGTYDTKDIYDTKDTKGTYETKDSKGTKDTKGSAPTCTYDT